MCLFIDIYTITWHFMEIVSMSISVFKKKKKKKKKKKMFQYLFRLLKNLQNMLSIIIMTALLFDGLSQQIHDVSTTSPQRRCNVMTLHRRWADVVYTSCARWVSTTIYIALLACLFRASFSGYTYLNAPINVFAKIWRGGVGRGITLHGELDNSNLCRKSPR